jgi:hypothetical protein
MKLEYDVIEDLFDDTTNIRTMSEQAMTPDGGWLIRTTVYTPHHITMNVIQLSGKKKKNKKLFDSVA